MEIQGAHQLYGGCEDVCFSSVMRQERTRVGGRCRTVVPVLLYLQVDDPGHNQRGHQQVGDGQADDQVVGGGLQSLLPRDGHAHQHVAEDDDEDEEGEQHGVVVVRVAVVFFRLIVTPRSVVKHGVIVGILCEDIH